MTPKSSEAVPVSDAAPSRCQVSAPCQPPLDTLLPLTRQDNAPQEEACEPQEAPDLIGGNGFLPQLLIGPATKPVFPKANLWLLLRS